VHRSRNRPRSPCEGNLASLPERIVRVQSESRRQGAWEAPGYLSPRSDSLGTIVRLSRLLGMLSVPIFRSRQMHVLITPQRYRRTSCSFRTNPCRMGTSRLSRWMGLDMVRMLRQYAHYYPTISPSVYSSLIMTTIEIQSPSQLRRLTSQLRCLRWMSTGKSIVLRFLSMCPKSTSFI